MFISIDVYTNGLSILLLFARVYIFLHGIQTDLYSCRFIQALNLKLKEVTITKFRAVGVLLTKDDL